MGRAILNQARSAGLTGIPPMKPASLATAAFLCGLVVSTLFTGSLAQAQTDASQIALQHPGWIQAWGKWRLPATGPKTTGKAVEELCDRKR